MLTDELDRRIINRLQRQLPVCDRPYDVVAQELDTTEEVLLQRLQGLLDDGILTRFGPLFNAQKMGGALSLCAMAIPEPEFDGVAEIVNALPQVAHNYERGHKLNMWFVLATGRPEELAQSITQIEKETGYPVYNFPKEEEFFVGLYLEA